jgi:hypothetical protein
MRIAEAAEIVLNGAQAPMHARDIAAVMEVKKLFEFRTTEKASVVSKALAKSEKFARTAPGMFALR